MAKVVIGVDPHKRTNAVVALSGRGKTLACQQFDNTAEGFRELKGFWHQCADSYLGHRRMQRCGQVPGAASGGECETVLDVSTRRAALVRVFAGGNRKLNHVIHIAAVTQVRSRGCAGHAYFRRSLPRARPRRKRCGR